MKPIRTIVTSFIRLSFRSYIHTVSQPASHQSEKKPTKQPTKELATLVEGELQCLKTSHLTLRRSHHRCHRELKAQNLFSAILSHQSARHILFRSLSSSRCRCLRLFLRLVLGLYLDEQRSYRRLIRKKSKWSCVNAAQSNTRERHKTIRRVALQGDAHLDCRICGRCRR